ncbi:MAG TPA: hypothetical protein PKV21_03855 [bacterium]|nr:hypothetical protein [bacterium]
MIYVECKPDKLLVEKLGINKNLIYHAGGSKVIMRLFKVEKGCGIIDEDPHAPSKPRKFINNFRLKDEKMGIKIFQDIEGKKKIIMLCPKLEGWILKLIEKYGIDLENFDLPNDTEMFHKIVNSNIESYEKLILELKNKEEFLFLKNEICEILEK